MSGRTQHGLPSTGPSSFHLQQAEASAQDASVEQELVGQAQRKPLPFSHEAVNHVVRIQEKPGHSSVRSNAEDERTLAGARASAWNVELNDGAILFAHEAVIHICPVNIPSRDCSFPIDSKWVGTLEGTRDATSVGSVKRGEGAILIAQETVIHESRVSVIPRDRPVRVDDEGG
jgi:hypothetical protein